MAAVVHVSAVSHSDITCMAFQPDGSRLAMAITPGPHHLRVPRTIARRELRAGNDDSVLCMAFSSDGARLLCGTREHSVELWNCIRGQLAMKFQGHTKEVTDVTFSPDRPARCPPTSLDQTTRIWESGEGRELIALGLRLPSGVLPSVLDGAQLATADDEGVTISHQAIRNGRSPAEAHLTCLEAIPPGEPTDPAGLRSALQLQRTPRVDVRPLRTRLRSLYPLLAIAQDTRECMAGGRMAQCCLFAGCQVAFATGRAIK